MKNQEDTKQKKSSKDHRFLEAFEEETGIVLEKKGTIVPLNTKAYRTDPRYNVLGISLNNANLHNFPHSLLNFKKLERLWLYGNKISYLPKDIDKLENLEFLQLEQNNLKSLPPKLFELENLTHLDLKDNKITMIPKEITKLEYLEYLNLAGNPIKHPPPEIIRQGVKAIFSYLKNLPDKDNAKVVNEAKLLLVGQGDVGKTCLAKRLINNTFQKETSTEGIDILKWGISVPNKPNQKILLNVWDFGGQEIYHSTHQFFLTKRSVYLLVWNARKSMDYEHIYKWLHTIEAFGEDSPIILVMSKYHERDAGLNMIDLNVRFQNTILDLYKVDSQDGFGIPSLKKIIQQTAWQLPHMNEYWIPTWFNVRNILENDGRSWITLKEYFDICKIEGLDREQAMILSEYLHHLGIILHFKENYDLKNILILQPEWATHAVYKILDHKEVRNRDGILLKEELPKIWNQKVYPRITHHLLVELMCEFELAYKLPDNSNYLIAELLPDNPPIFKWNFNNNLRFLYTYDFIPEGVMTRFIVRMHENLEIKNDGNHVCWREGAVLRYEDTRAFIKLWRQNSTVEIRIAGRKKREFLAIIRREFDLINNRIKKVNISKEIPCNCCDDCPKVWNYDNLLRLENKGVSNLVCDISGMSTTVNSLLDGYVKRSDRKIDLDNLLKLYGLHFHFSHKIDNRVITRNIIPVENFCHSKRSNLKKKIWLIISGIVIVLGGIWTVIKIIESKTFHDLLNRHEIKEDTKVENDTTNATQN